MAITKAYLALNTESLRATLTGCGFTVKHIEGRNNGLLYNGKLIIAMPNDGNEFDMTSFLAENPEVVNCHEDIEKFIEIMRQDTPAQQVAGQNN